MLKQVLAVIKYISLLDKTKDNLSQSDIFWKYHSPTCTCRTINGGKSDVNEDQAAAELFYVYLNKTDDKVKAKQEEDTSQVAMKDMGTDVLEEDGKSVCSLIIKLDTEIDSDSNELKILLV